MDSNSQGFKFCQKCGRKLLPDAEFCDSCGARQITVEQAQPAPQTVPVTTPEQAQPAPQTVPVTTPEQAQPAPQTVSAGTSAPYTAPYQQFAVPQAPRKSKTPLIIGICVGAAVLLISVIITVLIVSSAIGGNGSTALAAGTSEIKRSGSEITSGNAFFYHSDGVNLFSISTMEDTTTDGYAVSAMIPDSYLSEGTKYDKSVLTLDNCYGEYYVIEDGVTNIYNTKDNPEMFVSLVFTPVKLSGDTAEFTISAAISYDKEEFTFEGRGYAVDGSKSTGGDTTSVQPAVTDSPSVNNQIPIISNKCTVCHGNGICQVCHGRGGMSYATYGQGGDGWVVCQGCKGSRRCKYCNGTGRMG